MKRNRDNREKRIDRTIETIEQYNNMLDYVFGNARIAGLEYATSYALRELDPIAYKEGFLDYIDSEGIDIDELEDIDTWIKSIP